MTSKYVEMGDAIIYRVGDEYLIEKKSPHVARILDIVSQKPAASNYIAKTVGVSKNVIFSLEGLIHKFNLGAFFIWYKDPIANISQLLKLGYYPRDYFLKTVHMIARYICNHDAKSHIFSVSVKTFKNMTPIAHVRAIGDILLRLTEEIGGEPLLRSAGYVYVFDKYKVSEWCAKTW
ncbi:MAG: hypothetical protein QW328_07255 [Nitrososphaerota archaeon]